jgi:hypothetical protein
MEGIDNLLECMVSLLDRPLTILTVGRLNRRLGRCHAFNSTSSAHSRSHAKPNRIRISLDRRRIDDQSRRAGTNSEWPKSGILQRSEKQRRADFCNNLIRTHGAEPTNCFCASCLRVALKSRIFNDFSEPRHRALVARRRSCPNIPVRRWEDRRYK